MSGVVSALVAMSLVTGQAQPTPEVFIPLNGLDDIHRIVETMAVGFMGELDASDGGESPVTSDFYQEGNVERNLDLDGDGPAGARQTTGWGDSLSIDFGEWGWLDYYHTAQFDEVVVMYPSNEVLPMSAAEHDGWAAQIEADKRADEERAVDVPTPALSAQAEGEEVGEPALTETSEGEVGMPQNDKTDMQEALVISGVIGVFFMGLLLNQMRKDRQGR